MSESHQHDGERSPSSGAAGSGDNGSDETPTRKNTGRGILKKITPADSGLIEVPALAPHLEFRRIDDGQVLLVSETFNTLLRGQIHGDLLPLLDGRHSHQDITAALAGEYSAHDVQTALVSLASRGYIVSGEYAMGRGPAAYWSSLGAEYTLRKHELDVTVFEASPHTGGRIFGEEVDGFHSVSTGQAIWRLTRSRKTPSVATSSANFPS